MKTIAELRSDLLAGIIKILIQPDLQFTPQKKSDHDPLGQFTRISSETLGDEADLIVEEGCIDNIRLFKDGIHEGRFEEQGSYLNDTMILGPDNHNGQLVVWLMDMDKGEILFGLRPA